MTYRRKAGRLYHAVLVILIICYAFLIVVAEAEVETQLLSQFDIFEADIRDVFRSLAELGDLNILLDKDVTGKITINLKHGLKISEAVELLARTYGYSYRWIIPRRTVIIGSEKTFADWETKETRVYKMRYSTCEEMVNALGVVIPKEQIGANERTNQLTINASILEHQNIEELINRLDRRMPQINIEARVEEISLTVSRDLGVSWAFQSFRVDSNLRFHLTTAQTLTAMEEQGMARLLANPNISTTDRQEGRIFIGDRLPIITTTVKDGQVEDQVTYIEAGTVLTIVPQVNDEKTVTVTVKAEVSNIIDWVTGQTGNSVPVVRTREASSVVRLQEGETFVLSGLNLKQDVETVTSVPFMAKLPFFGLLFKRKTKDPWEDTEICIFLTPFIVRSAEEEILAQPKGKDRSTSKGIDVEVVWDLEPDTSEMVIVEPDNVKRAETPEMALGPDSQKEVAEEDFVVSEQKQLTTGKVATKKVDRPEPSEPNFKITRQIREGDTLEGIAQKYGILPEHILAENKAFDNFSPGQNLILKIPVSHLYRLKHGETLWRLAKRYGITVELLMDINEITNFTTLPVGRVIILPVPTDLIADDRF